MLHRDKLKEYEQTEARDILRLFEAARPTQDVYAPADFRLKVLQKVSAQGEQSRSVDWVTSWVRPALVPALTALLVLSVGANAWLATRSLGTSPLADGRTAPRDVISSESYRPASASAFQAGLAHRDDLGELVTAQSTINERMVGYGFASKPAPAQSYVLGTLYAEALAYVRSDDAAAASRHWSAIRQAVQPVASPLALYAEHMETLLKTGRQSDTADLMALFEPLYENSAGARADQIVPLFRAGTWLTNMRLAAVAGDKAALHTPNTIRYFKNEMVRLEAPRGVLDALDGMSLLVEQDSLSDRDVKGMLRLVKKMQRLLG